MNSDTDSNPIAEVLCREVKDGDESKFKAKSSRAGTGGGARDFRYSKEKYGNVLNRFFPFGPKMDRNTWYRYNSFSFFDRASLTWGKPREVLLKCEPTNSRSSEVYIARTSQLPFDENRPKVDESDGLLFLALVRMRHGLPRIAFITERQINNPSSNSAIAAKMNEAIEHKRGNDAVIFSIRFE